jgi:hypothetical protein
MPGTDQVQVARNRRVIQLTGDLNENQIRPFALRRLETISQPQFGGGCQTPTGNPADSNWDPD